MNLAGFCRNCLSKWYREEAGKKGIEKTIGWKKHGSTNFGNQESDSKNSAYKSDYVTD